MRAKKFVWFLSMAFAVAAIAGLFSTAYAALTPAGTVIENKATVNYKDDNLNSLPAVTSDPATARTVVSQVYGVDVSPPAESDTALAGTTAYHSATITNTGNGNDTYNLSAASSSGYTTNIYFDADGDGVLDASELAAGPITSTTQLPANGTYKVIVTVNIPAGAADGSTDTTTLIVTSQGDGTKTDTGVFTTTVSKAVLTLTKAQDVSSPKPGDIITYTVTYTNAGTSTVVNSVIITDPIPADATYVSVSIVLNGTPQTDASGDDSAEFSSNTVKASAGNVAPGGSGTIVFKVQVKADTPAGTQIFNTVTANYKDPDGNPQTPVNYTTPPATVAQVGNVMVEPDQSKNADPGDQVVYKFTVTNTGNDDDLFNGLITSTLGLTWAFYVDTNGNGTLDAGDIPASDSDGDGAPDTGMLAAGETKKYLAIATIPPGTADGMVDTTTLTGISKFDGTVRDSATLTTNVTAPKITVNKTVSPEGDQPPGTQLTYTIKVTNSGTGNAKDVIVTDSVPSSTNYVANSVTLNAASQTDLADGDQTLVSAGSITATIGTLGPAGTATITFKVTIK